MNNITFVEYEHHGAQVSVREDLKGQHRAHCLCYSCEKFQGGSGSENGCPIAKKVFALCVDESLVLPVWECPVFEEVA